MHPFERFLHHRTAQITAYRFVRHNQLIDERREMRIMALELKGLKANMRKLQSTVEELNSMAIAANEKGSTLKSHLGDVESQLGAHVDDIEFTAGVLGNSSGGSEKPKEPPSEKQVIAPGDIGKVAGVLTEVAGEATPTFRAAE